jgi:uncharacterized membrane protein
VLPDPLHPAIVHFPIVLAILLPIVSGAALWAVRRGAAPIRAWGIAAATAAALTISAWLAVETGEAQEERVERVVPEQVLDRHAEAAERFAVLAGVLLLVSGVGLAGGRVGRAARMVATVGSLGLAGAGVQVGHTGGKLVYQHGAASAYATAAPAQVERSAAEREDD